jgi:hypothetical protein
LAPRNDGKHDCAFPQRDAPGFDTEKAARAFLIRRGLILFLPQKVFTLA